jgi:hypothetical protein
MATEEEQTPLLVSCIFFSVSVLVLLLTFHLKNRRKDSGQLFFGKVHDEIILILVIFSVIMIVYALSLPLELFFLVSTFFVSLFVFVGTKMVRFNAENVNVSFQLNSAVSQYHIVGTISIRFSLCEWSRLEYIVRFLQISIFQRKSMAASENCRFGFCEIQPSFNRPGHNSFIKLWICS